MMVYSLVLLTLSSMLIGVLIGIYITKRAIERERKP